MFVKNCQGAEIQAMRSAPRAVSDAFEACGYERELGRVTVSNRPDLCEYQCNGAMAGAKKYHKAPFMIADEVAEKLQSSKVVKDVYLAGAS